MKEGLLLISFLNDYSEGAHPKVLQRLVDTNLQQATGYGTDNFTTEATAKIKDAIDCPQAKVCFLTGGTQTNQIVIDALLQSYQGVIAVDSGHINLHEAGAIEFTGHKVLTLPGKAGKLQAQTVADYVQNFYEDDSYQQMVFPGMVYISYPTEYGTLYSKQELTDLATVCRKYHMPLYIDGARLGYGLMSAAADMTIKDIAQLADVFYIGGTKIGALCGEAVVFTKNNEPEQFYSFVKRHGALLAKGRLNSLQFLELFTDNLYFDISQHAVAMALKLKQGFLDKGYQLYIDSPTNQQFFIMDNQKVQELSQQVLFTRWEKYNENQMIIRFVTSWATPEKDIDQLLALI